MRTLFVLIGLLLGVPAARADDYYCMFFATDSSLPQYVHVWGTFVQMKDKKVVKQVTISWTPTNKWKVSLAFWRKTIAEGFNMSLEDSMALSEGRGTCIWGPYEISEDTFDKAQAQYYRPGKYKMWDANDRPYAVNCIHRLTDITGVKATTHIRYGKLAAVAVYRHYNRLELLSWTGKGDEVISALGLDKYKLVRR